MKIALYATAVLSLFPAVAFADDIHTGTIHDYAVDGLGRAVTVKIEESGVITEYDITTPTVGLAAELRALKASGETITWNDVNENGDIDDNEVID